MCFGSCGRSPGWCSMCFVTKLTAACPPRPSRHMRLELTARCIVLGMPLLSLHAAKLVERGKEYTWRAVRQEAWGIYEEYDGPCHFCGLIDDEPPEPVAKEDKWIGFRKSVERVKTSFCRENIAETNMHDLTVKDKETDPWNIRNGLREGVLRGGNRCCSSVKSPDKKLRLRLPGESGTFMAMSDADGMVTKEVATQKALMSKAPSRWYYGELGGVHGHLARRPRRAEEDPRGFHADPRLRVPQQVPNRRQKAVLKGPHIRCPNAVQPGDDSASCKAYCKEQGYSSGQMAGKGRVAPVPIL
eukprot:gnl/TRDRNA2_/TRDRNA2_176434_c4_seq5.p1 gnl/TRDRNA2_/TRDRNA2_176434_c4~~gnl/TRDRNA2_/TRDRNA2_176434_c4_seq5.p1  ORF type:complete len:301 (-),score=34.96 gnl/TRDRNA2_/TRDRNA2_176434_c4_seq5:294-1196(-)